MNGTLESPKQNLEQNECRKRIMDGAESNEASAESEEIMCLQEPLTLSKKIPEIQLQDVNGRCITVYSKNLKEDPLNQNEENIERTKNVSEEEKFQNCTIDFKKIEKYEEVCTTNVTNKIVHIEENVPSFQDQLVSACNKIIRKQKSQDNDLMLNINNLIENESEKINENGFSINGVDDHTYTTAQTLRVRTVKEDDKIELQTIEQTTAQYTRNTDVYSRKYSSSENEQETAELYSDKDITTTLDDIENLNKDALTKPNKEAEKVLIHESEFGFTVEEKHYISKTEKQRADNLICKPPTVELTMTKPQPFPVITTQPCRKDMRSETVTKPLPQTVIIKTDEVDTKISVAKIGDEKKEAETKNSDILSNQYKSSCISECLCCIVQSFI